MGKYEPLRDYLAGRSGDEERMTFAELERLVGPLPDSALKHRAWWANDSKSQALAWQAAGWHVVSVNQLSHEVVFARGAKSGRSRTQRPALSANVHAAGGSVATRRSRFLDLGPVWISAIGTLLAALIAGIGLLLSNSAGSKPGQSTPAPLTGTILAPANVPPRVGLCSQQLSIGADGNAGPISCSNGDLNQLAWQYLASNHLNVMALGSDALPDQILRAMCGDLKSGGSTKPIELNAYNISALYYGWKFGISPGQEFMDGNC